MKQPLLLVCAFATAMTCHGLSYAAATEDTTGAEPPFELVDLQHAEKIIGLKFTAQERELMFEDLTEQLAAYLALRDLDLPNNVPPSLLFQPLPLAKQLPAGQAAPRWSDPGEIQRPQRLEDVAFWPIGRIAELIASGQVTSLELTGMYLARLQKHGPQLECVVSLTEEIALAQAQKADAEIRAGKYRGPLHGIPYGVKDLFAVAGTKTTWGAEPYRDQVIDDTATVVKKLQAAGAVLCAKLTLGALAWGDVWYGGKTKNPWNLEQGSSGSSAGPAAAVAAGLIPFALGTETWGSIVSPCTRVGVTGLRPTFGRVSRAGAMALSWSMDKIGPICRTVEDCAIVFEAIRGSDGRDQTVFDAPFGYRPDVRWNELRIGYLKSAFEEEYDGRELDLATLDVLRDLGAELVAIELPDQPIEPLAFILSAEAAAAFDELTLSGRDDLMVRQERHAWPNVFRASHLIPAVAYLQANRARYLLVQEMEALMSGIDLYVTPTFGGQNLLLTNLTGHPCIVVPNGFAEESSPRSITFIGDLFDEATVLAVAKAYQDATTFHLQKPPGY